MQTLEEIYDELVEARDRLLANDGEPEGGAGCNVRQTQSFVQQANKGDLGIDFLGCCHNDELLQDLARKCYLRVVEGLKTTDNK